MINFASNLFVVLLFIMNISLESLSGDYNKQFPELSASSETKKSSDLLLKYAPSPNLEELEEDIFAEPILADFMKFWSDVSKYIKAQRHDSSEFIMKYTPDMLRTCYFDLWGLWMDDVMTDGPNLYVTYNLLTELRHEPAFYDRVLRLLRKFTIATQDKALESKIFRGIAKIYARKNRMDKAQECVELAIFINPKDYVNYLWLGNLPTLESEIALENLYKAQALLEDEIAREGISYQRYNSLKKIRASIESRLNTQERLSILKYRCDVQITVSVNTYKEPSTGLSARNKRL